MSAPRVSEEMWVTEVKPAEEEKAKVNGRVTRCRQNLDDAKERKGGHNSWSSTGKIVLQGNASVIV